jgi:hypothetical protein
MVILNPRARTRRPAVRRLVVPDGHTSHVGLDDLPVHRREALLWRYALELDYDGVDALVQENEGGQCRVRWGASTAAAEYTAVLGDDGRYHMLIDGNPQCAEKRKRHDPAGTVRHGQWCHWWTDGTRYLTQAPAAAWSPDGLLFGQCDDHVVTWLVTLTEVVTDPVLVPTRRRCVHHSAPSRSAMCGSSGLCAAADVSPPTRRGGGKVGHRQFQSRT